MISKAPANPLRRSIPRSSFAWWERIPRFTIEPVAVRIESNSMPVPECGCWIWMRSLNQRGYGQMSFEGYPTSAHRVSYQVFRGEIPEGKHVLHTCDVRVCVNPDHLYLGTDVENCRDRMVRGRHKKPPVTKLNLTEEQIREIRQSSERYSVLGRRYGICGATCKKVKLGLSGGPL